MIPELIERLLGGESADPKALEDALNRIMMGEVPQLQTAGLLVALRVREPDAPTLAACARAMRAHRLAVQTEVQPLIDTCGTGGDRTGSFNISTAAALVVAACGGAVAKHGNRSVSSKAGSADVLEASGAVLSLGPKEVSTCLDSTGFAVKDGPLILKGNVTVSGGSGRSSWIGKQVALCRCGASENKPFCDGSHKKIGFKSDPNATGDVG